MNKHLAIVSGLLVGSFLMAGCGATAHPSSAPHSPSTVRPSAATSATPSTTASRVPPPATVITLDMVSARQGWAINTKG